MFNGTFGNAGTGAATAGNVMTAVVIVAGVLMMILGIIMIVLASRLIRTPSVSDNGVIADRKGIVIFFLVINIIAFLGSIMNFFGGAAMAVSSIVVMLAYLASAILAGLFPQRKTRRQLRKKNKQLQRQLLSCRVGSAFGRSFCFCICVAAFSQLKLYIILHNQQPRRQLKKDTANAMAMAFPVFLTFVRAK